MDIRNLIQPTARQVRIVDLGPGDAYKRMGKRVSYGDPELILGVVTDVVSNGDDVLVTVFELDPDYSATNRVKLTTLNVGEEQAVFPATPEEIGDVLTKIRTRLDADVESKRRELDRAVDQRDRGETLFGMIESGQLKALTHTVVEEDANA